MLHRLPYMLFGLIAFVCTDIEIALYPSRKNFYYADHGVFTIHLYIFTFILLLVVFAIERYGAAV